jgi:tight adherence protein B
MTLLLLAAAGGGLLPPLPALLLYLAWEHPELAGPLLLAGAWQARRRHHRHGGDDQVAWFLRTVAAELRAGQSLRSAIGAAGLASPELAPVGRMAAAGLPLEEVAAALARNRKLEPAAAAVRVAARTGGSVVAAFDALTVDAADEAALALETRTLTVQARISVLIVGGFPLVVLAMQAMGGGLAATLALGTAGRVIVGIGLGFLATGLAAVGWLMRRARR